MRAFNLITPFLISSLLTAVSLDGFAQSRLVESYRLKSGKVNVYFKDPLVLLDNAISGFDAMPDEKKVALFDSCLLHSDLYTFVVTGPAGDVTSYVVRGNPKKQNSSLHYELAVMAGNAYNDPKLAPAKVVDKFGLNGEFFEHMELMGRPQYRNKEAVQIWGYFTRIKPFAEVKKTVNYFIDLDKGSGIPENLLADNRPPVAPLFSYQQCALDKVRSRTFTVTVYQYDAQGKVTRADERLEKSDYLYESSTDDNDLLGVTTLPFFSSSDTVMATARADSFLVHTSQPFLRHYLKDVYAIRENNTTDVTAIGGTLLIHGYGADGHSVDEERYLAEFGPVGACSLPVRVSYFYPDDRLLQRPRLVVNIKYDLK